MVASFHAPNPQIPATPSAEPILPPLPTLPFTSRDGRLSLAALQFLQQIYAALLGLLNGTAPAWNSLQFAVVPVDAVDDAAAAAASVPVGGVYRDGSVLKVRVE